MEHAKKILFMRISSETADACFAELFCYGAAILVFVLGVAALRKFEVTQVQAFLAVLVILSLALQLVLGGLIVGIRKKFGGSRNVQEA